MKLIITHVALLLVVVGGHAESLNGTRPNIILVMTDDQGPHLSFEGHPYLRTPHIDKFAAKALRLREFHVSPTCSPTRAAVLSGRHEFRNGVTGTTKERERMALSTTTFPQLLRTAGYETGIFGKWHLGDPKAYRPAQRGFSESLIHGAGGIGQLYPGSCADFPPNRENRYFNPVLLHNEQVVQGQGYCADIFFRSALGWMKKSLEARTPFFAMITPNTPHAPLMAPEENKRRIRARMPDFNETVQAYGKKIKPAGLIEYYGMIENLDDNFGLMMKKLAEWGALENTLIIFTTDNGASSRHGGLEIHNAGFKTGKGSVNEGGVHVPCYWQWKGRLPENVDVKALTAHIDLYKTFCELAGVSIPGNIQPLDGRSLVALMVTPDAPWADRMLFHTAGRWDLGVDPQRDKRWAVRTQKWRLVGGKTLFDIENDPFEGKNVIDEHPEVAARLQQAYYKWWETAVPLMVNENAKWEKDEPPYYTLYKEAVAKGKLPKWESSK